MKMYCTTDIEGLTDVKALDVVNPCIYISKRMAPFDPVKIIMAVGNKEAKLGLSEMHLYLYSYS